MSARSAYPNATIYLIGSMSAAQAEQVARDTGRDIVHDQKSGNFSLEQKREKAIAYLRERNLYVLDKGARKPSWGNGHLPDGGAAA